MMILIEYEMYIIILITQSLQIEVPPCVLSKRLFDTKTANYFYHLTVQAVAVMRVCDTDQVF